MKKSKRMQLSPQDGLKSARDAILFAVGGVLPQLLEILGAVDFGEYTAIVSIIIAMVTPLINRFIRNK